MRIKSIDDRERRQNHPPQLRTPSDSNPVGTFTVRKTQDWKWDKEFNIQLHPTELSQHRNLSVGTYVLVKNPHNELAPGLYGRLDKGQHLESGEVGIGFDMRHALGVPREDSRLNSVNVYHRMLEKKCFNRRLFDRALHFRPIICRVRYAVHPDIGFQTCRLPEETFDVLGIEHGDRVYLQSAHDRTNLKALPAREGIQTPKAKQKEQNSEQYQDCQDILDIKSIVGTEVDLPCIYLDAEQRERAGLDQTSNGGQCQPIIVYRDSRAYFMRKLNEVAIPVVGAILGFTVVFRDILDNIYLFAGLAIAVVLIIFSLFYNVRFESLD